MLQTYVPPCLMGTVHKGPRLVFAFGMLIRAFGPAACWPLKGVGFFESKPQGAAALGSSNQKPTWNAFVGAKAASLLNVARQRHEAFKSNFF